MDLAGKKVLVVGIARSGLSAIKLLASKGARVFADDLAPRDKLGRRYDEALPFVEDIAVGRYVDSWFGGVDLVVVSPGVPLADPIFSVARDKGIPVLSEVEVAFWFVNVPILAVTGSNGKSTTVALAGEILETSGLRTFVGGNFGRALSELPLSQERYQIACVELSSFQLEAIHLFHPRACVVTNLAPNHQDRYPSFEAYVAAKKNIFRNMQKEDLAGLNANCASTAKFMVDLPCAVRWFGDPEIGGVYIEDETLFVKRNGGMHSFDINTFRLKGGHNLENLMAAALLAFAGGATEAGLAKALRSFNGLPHRLENVGEQRGVHFINDSKATSPDAVLTALRATSGPVILLLGGKDKGGDFTRLEPFLKSRVRTVITFGEAGRGIARVVSRCVRTIEEGTLATAFKRAAAEARHGDTVLLSPGCASQDAYTDFERRGDHFREMAHAL